MRCLILLPCFVFTFLSFFSSVSYGFSYDIDKFTVTSGTSTFVDEFDDNVEPGPPTYGVLGSFSSNAESLGLLNLNSNDATPGPESVIGASLADSTYFINQGSGGRLEGDFRFTNGFETNTGFIITIHDTPLSELESSSLWIQKTVSGSIVAFFDSWTADPGTIISQTDITGLLGTSTDITLRLDVSTADVVTASLDIGSNGSFIAMPGSYTLAFPGGTMHTGAFLAFADPIPDPVPEPATVALLGIGLAGLAGAEVRRRRKKKAIDKG